ncbi:MAG TPA: sulfurtransferase [Gemmatimonadales bacterium]|nr:sulfurtransferase [Gemmatimonadales bacterium]
MIRGTRLAALPAALAVAAIVACSRPAPEPPSAGPPSATVSPYFVTPDLLAAALADAGTVVLHVARDRNEYDAGHVPGAQFLPLGAIVVERDGVPNELPEPATLDSVFESVGVTDGSRVVLYGEPLVAARAYFTLDYLGHGEQVAVLDGGLGAWRLAGRPVTRDAQAAAPAAGGLTARPRPDLVVGAAWVAERLQAPGVAMLDARPADEYSGDKAGEGVERPGHITGAASLFWKETIVSDVDPRLVDAARLGALFVAAGAEPGDTVVTYCRTGVQASHLYLVARRLGYVVRMYDGSYLDWSRREALPVATGEGAARTGGG